MKNITLDFVKENFPKREKNTNKGDYGTLLSICGSYGMAGAAILSSKAALRCGVGLLNIAVSKKIYNIVSSNLLESIFTIFDDEESEKISKSIKRSTACLIGCGIGTDKKAKKILNKIIKKYDKPLVIDADGLNIFAENKNKQICSKNVIFTPHPGEMSRLTNLSIDEIQNNREEISVNFAKKHNVVLVLKGQNTLITSPNGEIHMNTIGNPGMAKAGSGDVLAGIISSFLAQGMSALNSAICGVYIHSAVGDICSDKYSENSMLPSDMINELSNFFKKVLVANCHR